MKTLFAALFFLFLSSQAAAEPYQTVSHNVVCTDPKVAVEVMLVVTFGMPESCQVWPGTSNIDEIMSGPYIDFEGDKFWLVRIRENLYTWAWPGITVPIDFAPPDKVYQPYEGDTCER